MALQAIVASAQALAPASAQDSAQASALEDAEPSHPAPVTVGTAFVLSGGFLPRAIVPEHVQSIDGRYFIWVSTRSKDMCRFLSGKHKYLNSLRGCPIIPELRRLRNAKASAMRLMDPEQEEAFGQDKALDLGLDEEAAPRRNCKCHRKRPLEEQPPSLTVQYTTHNNEQWEVEMLYKWGTFGIWMLASHANLSRLLAEVQHWLQTGTEDEEDKGAAEMEGHEEEAQDEAVPSGRSAVPSGDQKVKGCHWSKDRKAFLARRVMADGSRKTRTFRPDTSAGQDVMTAMHEARLRAEAWIEGSVQGESQPLGQ